jgi:hypothetical protein
MNANLDRAVLVVLLCASACRIPDPNVSGSTQTTFRSGHSAWVPTSAPDVGRESNDDGTQLIELRLTVAELPGALAAEIFGGDVGVGADWSGRVYDAGRAPDLGAMAKRDAEIEIVSRPRLVVRSGVTAEMSTSSVESYVRDVVVAADGRVEPVLDTVTEGTWFEALARNTSDPSVIELGSSVTRKAIERPIPERSLGDSDAARVQRPNLDVRTARKDVVLRAGQTVALSLVPSRIHFDRDARITVALVTVDRPAR